MFIAGNKVRMHDTDMAGILYFASLFRFVHDTFEDFLASEGLYFRDLFNDLDFAFVIVHAEGDYKVPLLVGDELEVHLKVSHIGGTSFSTNYQLYRLSDQLLVATAKIAHVAVDRERKKRDIPSHFKELLAAHKEN